MPLKEIEAPTWEGFGDAKAALKGYADFVVKHRVETDQNGPARIAEELRQAERRAALQKENLEYYQEDVTRLERELTIERAKLVEMTDDKAREMAEQLVALPYVVGTRLDFNGLPAVQIRVIAEQEGEDGEKPIERFDIGDFDLSFNNASSMYLAWCRRPSKDDGPLSHRLLNQFYSRANVSGTIVGQIDEHRPTFECAVEYVQHYYSRLVYSHERQCQRYGQVMFPQYEEPAPEVVWYQHLPVELLSDAIKRWYSAVVFAPINERIRSIESDLRYQRKHLEQSKEEFRTAKLRVRTSKADHQAALKAAQERNGQEPDLQQARKDLEYIAALPGVMGMRFLDDGTPVFHVRTSHVYQGRRYDLGDYEIRLRRCREELGVINIHSTRSGVYYNHPDFCTPDNRESWFCVQSRRYEVRNHFNKGQFRQLIHLLINTMCGVNEESRQYVSRECPEVAMDAVPHSKFTVGRNRPRRKPKAVRQAEDEAREATAAAADQEALDGVDALKEALKPHKLTDLNFIRDAMMRKLHRNRMTDDARRERLQTMLRTPTYYENERQLKENHEFRDAMNHEYNHFVTGGNHQW